MARPDLQSQAYLQAIRIATAKLKAQRNREASKTPADGNADVWMDDIWKPNPGAQQMLVNLITKTDVEEIWYMGEAGAGKTFAAIAVAACYFRNAIFFRRRIVDLDGPTGAIEKAKSIFIKGDGRALGHFNGNSRMWRLWTGGKQRFLEMDGVKDEKDKLGHQGHARELFVFDEITQFPPTIPEYITGWKRTDGMDNIGGRTLELYLGNPPVEPEGEWVTEKVRAWVDPSYPNPALPGEIRYFIAKDDGTSAEVSGPGKHKVGDREYTAKSRTMIPSVLDENPTYGDGAYAARLEQLPEPLRSILRRGDFMAGKKDGAWQCIPTEWVKAAQKRHGDQALQAIAAGWATDQLGVDVAHGGADATVVVGRRASWYDLLENVPGSGTPDGFAAADLVHRHLVEGAFAVIDANGVGASCYDIIRRRTGLRVVGKVPGTEEALGKDPSQMFGYANLRAALFWRFRLMLDPNSPTYEPNLALPNHPHVLADLCSANYSITPRGIQIEDKDAIKGRIGRSPDVGDAILLAAAVWLAPYIEVSSGKRRGVFSRGDEPSGPSWGDAESYR